MSFCRIRWHHRAVRNGIFKFLQYLESMSRTKSNLKIFFLTLDSSRVRPKRQKSQNSTYHTIFEIVWARNVTVAFFIKASSRDSRVFVSGSTGCRWGCRHGIGLSVVRGWKVSCFGLTESRTALGSVDSWCGPHPTLFRAGQSLLFLDHLVAIAECSWHCFVYFTTSSLQLHFFCDNWHRYVVYV